MTKQDDYIQKLEKVSNLTKEEAKKALLDEVQKELTSEIAKRIKLESQEKAKEILADAMKHAATTYTAEYTISTVAIANEEVKGKIIGREGRNIRSFEAATG